MFVTAFDVPGQIEIQHPSIKGIVRLRKLSFFFELLDDLPGQLCALSILSTVLSVM
jgi:hypothetical protein